MLEISAANIGKWQTKKFRRISKFKCFFMLITINTLTQSSLGLKHGTYMYIICVYVMAAILNMVTKEASGDLKSSQFVFTTVKT